MVIHKDKSSLAGQTVKIISVTFKNSKYIIEDWWDRLGQGSWMFCNGNPVCMKYAIRSSTIIDNLPTDNEVLYGKIDGLGCLIHISEIEKIQ